MSIKLFLLFLRIKYYRWIFPKIEAVFPNLAHLWSRKLFLNPLKFPAPEGEKEAFASAIRTKMDVLGKKIQVYAWGSGPPVVFMHGWSGRGTNFYHFIEKLNEKGFQVIAFDAPAHGFSEGTRTSFVEFVECLKQTEKEYGEFAGYVGHSLGGMGVYLWAYQKHSTKPVVMIGSPAEETDIFRTFFRRLNLSGDSIPKLRTWVEKMTGFDFDNQLPLYDKPLVDGSKLLLIHDEDDKDCDSQDAVKLNQTNPGSSLLITKGLGHIHILKDPGVIDRVVDFI